MKTHRKSNGQSAESGERLLSALESARMGAWDHDIRSNRTVASPRLRELLGVPADAPFTYETFLACVHEQDLPRVDRVNRAVMALEGGVSEYEVVFRTRGGRWLRSHGNVYCDAAGRPSRFTGATQDATREMEERQGLSRARTLLAAQLEALPDGVLTVGVDGTITALNGAMARMLGLDGDGLAGTPDGRLLRSIRPLLRDPDLIMAEHGGSLARRPVTAPGVDLELGDGRVLRYFGVEVRGGDGEHYGWSWIHRDVTRERLAQSDLERQKEVYRNIAEGMSDALLVLDAGWRVTHANRLAASWAGVPAGELVGLHAGDLFGGVPGLCELALGCAGQGGASRAEHFDQERGRWLEVRMVPCGEGVCVLANDITAHRGRERLLADSERQFRTLANSIAQLAWMARADGWIYWYNDRWYEYTGATPAEMEGWGWRGVHHPDHVDRVVEFVREAWQRPEPWELTFPLRGGDGAYRWFLTRAYPVLDAEGGIVSWIGTNTDVDRQLRAERALAQSEAQLRQISDSMPQIVWSTDARGDHDFFNRRWFEFTGMTAGQSAGEGWARALHPDDRAPTWRAWSHSLRTGEPYEVEYRMRRHDGEYRWLLARAIPIADASGAVVRWFGSCTDIHEQRTASVRLEEAVRQRTRELLRANEHLREVNQEIEQFNYAASHDLQEPLRKIRIFTERVIHKDYGRLGGQSREMLSKVIRAVDRMAGLLVDLRAFSDIARQDRFTDVDMGGIMGEVLEELQVPLADLGGVIECGDLPVVRAVPAQMRLLLLHLCDNAVKYASPRRPPRIEVGCEAITADEAARMGIDAEGGGLLFRVSDNGIGFEQAFADKVFTLFRRLHGREEYEGNGLGLALCRKIVTHHGGGIWVESEPGRGSVFRFLIPHRTDGGAP